MVCTEPDSFGGQFEEGSRFVGSTYDENRTIEPGGKEEGYVLLSAPGNDRGLAMPCTDGDLALEIKEYESFFGDGPVPIRFPAEDRAEY